MMTSNPRWIEARVDVSERVLLEEARAGNHTSFEHLIRPHWDVAFRAAYLITRNAHDAEDAVQEALLATYVGLPAFRTGSAFRPWFLRIVTNESLTCLRKRKRDQRLHLTQLTKLESASIIQSLDHEVITAEMRQTILSALEELDDVDQVILTHRYLLDLSIQDIAKIVDRPESTIRTRISRALRKLRSILVERSTSSPRRDSLVDSDRKKWTG